MIVDGNAIRTAIAEELRERIRTRPVALTLGVISMSDAPVTRKYLERKRKFAEEIGVTFTEISIPITGSQEDVERGVATVVGDPLVSGVLVQLPLPSSIDTAKVLNMIPVEKDVDVLSENARHLFREGKGVLPPVIGAMQEILDRTAVSLLGKRVVVVGEGNLVGKPAAAWAAAAGAEVAVIGEHTQNPEDILKTADIIMLGAGSPGFLKPDMISEGVIILDAGTTDVGGSLKGDADPSCAEKASLFTPVPGGIGPITIAVLFKNLAELSSKQN